MRKNILCIISIVLVSTIFTGCTTTDTPNYSSLQQNIKQIDVTNKQMKSSNYTFVYSQTIQMDIQGHSPTISGNYLDGTMELTELNNNIQMNIKAKIPIFSKYANINIKTDKCGAYINNSAEISVLNSDSSIDYTATSQIQSNPDILEALKNYGGLAKSPIICQDWKVGEIKDGISFYDSFTNMKIKNDEFQIIPLKLPLKYEGVVTYNEKNYYLFSIKNGHMKFVGASGAQSGSFTMNMKALVDMDTYIAERMNINTIGNILYKRYSVNFTLNDIFNANKIKEK